MMSQERDQIISAIKALGRRVTVSDVAAKTGLPLIATSRQLNAVASQCKATLQVTHDGNIIYAFAPAFESAYLTSEFAQAFKRALETTFKGAYYVLRVSFGATLIASLLT